MNPFHDGIRFEQLPAGIAGAADHGAVVARTDSHIATEFEACGQRFDQFVFSQIGQRLFELFGVGFGPSRIVAHVGDGNHVARTFVARHVLDGVQRIGRAAATAGRGASEYKALDQPRMADGKFLRHHAAERDAGDEGVGAAECMHQTGGVVGIIGHGVAAVRFGAAAEAAPASGAGGLVTAAAGSVVPGGSAASAPAAARHAVSNRREWARRTTGMVAGLEACL